MLNLSAEVIVGDNRETLKRLPEQSVQTVITSPPYWGLRDYGEGDQIGLESTPDEFVEQLCLVFDEVWRVLKDDGTLWLNLGDSYFGSWGNYGGENRGKGTQRQIVSGSHAPQQAYKELTKWRPPTAGKVDGIKPKDLVGIPWRVAFALQARGWYLRSDIIWHKPNPMPESVTDRPTKSHEYVFLLTKSPRYYYDHEAIREPVKEANKGQVSVRARTASGPLGGENQHNMEIREYDEIKGANKRTVWTVNTKPYKDAHFATYPPELIEPCILAGSAEGDIVLDPFSGSGTTGEMALKHGRNYIGLELNPEYATLSEKRLTEAGGMFAAVKITKGTQC
jgi:DNA modification methylase